MTVGILTLIARQVTTTTDRLSSTSGGDASHSKHITFNLLFFIMNFPITGSSAIEAIALADNTATVTFTGGRAYDYTVNDVTAFVTALNSVMSQQGSVGRFVNNSIKSKALQNVAA